MFVNRNFQIKEKYSEAIAEMVKDNIDPIRVKIETDPNLTENQMLKLDYYGVNSDLTAKLSLDNVDAIVELSFVRKLEAYEESSNKVE